MPLSRQFLFIGLFIFALLSTACQSQPGEVTGDEQQPPGGETIVSQAIGATITPLPTAILTSASASSPTPTNLSATTPPPTSTSLPTPTAIPVDAPTPTATNTSVPASVSLSSPNEVDLVTLEESLAVLDRVERRKVEPTSTPVRPIIYEGAASYVTKSKTGLCDCSTCNGVIFTAEVFIDTDGNVSGILKPRKVEFAGTRNAITGKRTSGPNNCEAYWTLTLQTRLTDSDQAFEGTLDSTFTPGTCSMDNCGGIWTFSLPRK